MCGFAGGKTRSWLCAKLGIGAEMAFAPGTKPGTVARSCTVRVGPGQICDGRETWMAKTKLRRAKKSRTRCTPRPQPSKRVIECCEASDVGHRRTGRNGCLLMEEKGAWSWPSRVVAVGKKRGGVACSKRLGGLGGSTFLSRGLVGCPISAKT